MNVKYSHPNIALIVRLPFVMAYFGYIQRCSRRSRHVGGIDDTTTLLGRCSHTFKEYGNHFHWQKFNLFDCNNSHLDTPWLRLVVYCLQACVDLVTLCQQIIEDDLANSAPEGRLSNM
jgi:hypothetical protein